MQYQLTPRSKWKMQPSLLTIPKRECPDIWMRLPDKWPKSWSRMEDPVVPLERNLYGHPLAGLLWERQFEKVLLQHGWEKVPNWECFKGPFLSVFVDDIQSFRQALGPSRFSKLGMTPFWLPLGGPENRNFDARTVAGP